MNIIEYLNKVGDLCNFSLTASGTEGDVPLIYVNKHFAELTGYSKEQVIGKNCRLLQGSKSQKEHSLALRSCIETGEATFQDIANYRKDGTSFVNRVVMLPMKGWDGNSYIVGIQNLVSEDIDNHQFLGLKDLNLSPKELHHHIRNPLAMISAELSHRTQEGIERVVDFLANIDRYACEQ